MLAYWSPQKRNRRSSAVSPTARWKFAGPRKGESEVAESVGVEVGVGAAAGGGVLGPLPGDAATGP
jgi:hypothetical protein